VLALTRQECAKPTRIRCPRAKCGEQDPTGTVEPRARHLPPQHLRLVPEHEVLDVPLIWSTTFGSEETPD
jgi:hypothetical protein